MFSTSVLSRFRPESVFLLLASVFGPLFLLFTPPGQIPDEPEHFYRAYQVSTGVWIPSRIDDAVGGWLPTELNTIEKMVARGFNGRQQRPGDIIDMIVSGHLTDSEAGKTFLEFPNMALHAPFLYLPQAVGIGVGRMFTRSPMALNYLGRLANLMAWIAIVFVAIRIVPMGKWLMLLVALTPISLFMAVSTSADALTYSLCLLFVALVLNVAFGSDSPTRVKLLFLLLVCGLVAFSKMVYAVLIFLVLVIPPSRFSSNKRYFAFAALCFSIAATTVLLWSAVVAHLWVPANPGKTAQPVAQLMFILSDPLLYTSILGSTIINHFDYFAPQLIGVLGWIDTPMPIWFYVMFFVALGSVSLLDHTSDFDLGVFPRLIFLCVSAVGTIMVFTAMYLNWNHVGSIVITGVQGRYFVPFVFVFALVFYGLIRIRSSSASMATSVLVFCIASLVYVSWRLFDRYYLL